MADAPSTAPYLLLAPEPTTLPNAQALVPGTGLGFTSTGGGGLLTISPIQALGSLANLSSASGFLTFNNFSKTVGTTSLATDGSISILNQNGVTGTPTLSVNAATRVQLIEASANGGSIVGTRPTLNFLGVNGASVSVTDNPGENRLDIAIDGSSGAGSVTSVGLTSTGSTLTLTTTSGTNPITAAGIINFETAIPLKNLTNNSFGIGAIATTSIGSGNIIMGISAGPVGANPSLINSISIGFTAIAGANGVAIGASAGSTASNSIAIGNTATSQASDSISIGTLATILTGASQSISIGRSSLASGSGNIAIGSSVVVAGTNSIAIGSGASTTSANQCVIGDNSIQFGIRTTNPTYAIDVGGGSNAVSSSIRLSQNAAPVVPTLNQGGVLSVNASDNLVFTNSVSSYILTPAAGGSMAPIIATCSAVNTDSTVSNFLPAFTYNNGTAGVGATITFNAVGAISNIYTDAINTIQNDIILYTDLNTTNAPYSGVYTITTKGDGSTQEVWTRHSNFNSTSNILAGTNVISSQGLIFPNAIAYVSTAPSVVGTDSIFFRFNGGSIRGWAAPKIIYGSVLTIPATPGTTTFNTIPQGRKLLITSISAINATVDFQATFGTNSPTYSNLTPPLSSTGGSSSTVYASPSVPLLQPGDVIGANITSSTGAGTAFLMITYLLYQ